MNVLIWFILIILGLWCMVAFAYALYVSFGLFKAFFHDWLGFHVLDDRNTWHDTGGWHRKLHCRCRVCKKVLTLDEKNGEWVVE